MRAAPTSTMRGPAGAGAPPAHSSAATGPGPGRSDSALQESLIPFLVAKYGADLEAALLTRTNETGYSIPMNFLDLADASESFAESLLRSPKAVLRVLDKTLLAAQERVFRAHPRRSEMHPKESLNARLHGLPFAGDTDSPLVNPEIGGIRSCHAGRLVALRGTVVSCGAPKLLELQRMYECTRCRHRFQVEVNIEMRGTMKIPSVCPSGREKPCKGTAFRHVEEAPPIYKDYQEIRLQESVQCLAMGSMPRSISVILQEDLVDRCRAGDDIEITGVVVNMWRSTAQQQRCNLQLVVRAVHMQVNNQSKSTFVVGPEVERQFEEFWELHRSCPLLGRNKILASLCPQVYGLFTVKLAGALLLLGGVPRNNVRGHLHMLIVGDPGTGKSQFMQYTARMSPRSVVTSGKGTSSAGLTVAAVKDGDQWTLEAGALVLADGGICCIDEFDSIKESDRASILEAMEQQTLSVAKAGLVTSLSTATSVFGVQNPKRSFDSRQSLAVNTGLSTPLLSRFDIVLVLLDGQNPEWDDTISSHILASHNQSDDPNGGGSSSKAEPAELDRDNSSGAKPWSIDVLRGYVSWAKQKFHPVMTPEAEEVLLRYYQLQRQSDFRIVERTTIRMLESLVRISQAHARLMARHKVTRQDAAVAVQVMDSSMNDSSVLSHGSAIHSGFEEDPDAAGADMEAHLMRLLGHIELSHHRPQQ